MLSLEIISAVVVESDIAGVGSGSDVWVGIGTSTLMFSNSQTKIGRLRANETSSFAGASSAGGAVEGASSLILFAPSIWSSVTESSGVESLSMVSTAGEIGTESLSSGRSSTEGRSWLLGSVGMSFAGSGIR